MRNLVIINLVLGALEVILSSLYLNYAQGVNFGAIEFFAIIQLIAVVFGFFGSLDGIFKLRKGKHLGSEVKILFAAWSALLIFQCSILIFV